jgi:hypothetical protein
MERGRGTHCGSAIAGADTFAWRDGQVGEEFILILDSK